MTIVEGKIETIKRLKERLAMSGITRFNSLGEIDRFLKNYEVERKQLPYLIESALEEEIKNMNAALARQQQIYQALKTNLSNEMTQKTKRLEAEIQSAVDKSRRNLYYKISCYLKIKSLSYQKSNLEKNVEDIIKKKISSEEDKVEKLKAKVADYFENKNSILSNRCKKSLEDLAHTKSVIDGLYTLIAGAVGENAVVKTLQQLPDDYYLINDFSLNFNQPIYNKIENDRIFSIQADHLLVSQSGIFILETKNWNRKSLENLDLRSPVKQILRSSYVLFTLLNSNSKFNDINLEPHHWGSKRIPIRNIIVMSNDKPKEEFKHVKVLSLSELNGYIKYFEPLFSAKEVETIFNYLKNKMRNAHQ